jgi:predicted DNA-binding transcriptional regulator AlpA
LTAVKPRLLDVPEAAVYLGLPESAIYDFATRGILRRVRIPLDGRDLRKLLFDKSDIDALIDRWKDGA